MAAVPSRHQARRVTADQWGEPHQVPQPNISNSPASTPDATSGTFQQGVAEGRSDWPEEAPDFGDASSHAPEFVRGHAQGYGDAARAYQPVQDVPVSLGGDNGQSLKHPHPAFASRHVASRQEMGHPDFQRGYKYAAKWRPGTPVVLPGTPELEAGIYAGLTDNPGQRAAWLAEHTALAARAPQLAQRVALHRQLTHRVAAAKGLPTDGTYLVAEAATTTFLDTTGPGTSPSPTGETPINGPGTTPPLAGRMDAAAAGGPSPYNGAPPQGSPVVPATTPGPDTDPSPQPSAPTVSPAVLAFRKRIQAAKLAALTTHKES
jgi:hypothetical protein